MVPYKNKIISIKRFCLESDMLYGIFRIDFIDLGKILEFKKSKREPFLKAIDKNSMVPYRNKRISI